MASGSVTLDHDAPPEAFRGYDASTFRAWAMAAADVQACGPNHCANSTMANLGGLIYNLIMAADELDAREREALKNARGG